MIILTGATGNTGTVVAERLKALGVPFKAMARSDRRRRQLEALGYETVYGDFDKPETLSAALSGGVERVYLVCTPDEHVVRRECAFIDAARAAGVRHVVKCSAFLAGKDAPTKNLRAHGHIEAHLAASGMDYTIVRPHGFMQTFVLFSLDLIVGAGALLQPGGDGAMPLVDVRDVAEVAVKALTERGHEGRAYDVTGPEALDFYAVARTLSAALHRPVTYVPGSEAAFTRALKLLGVPEVPSEHAIIIMRMCRSGEVAAKTDTLRALGIEPRTFAQFAEDLAAGRTGGGNSFEPPGGALAKVMGTLVREAFRVRFAVFGRPADRPSPHA